MDRFTICVGVHPVHRLEILLIHIFRKHSKTREKKTISNCKKEKNHSTFNFPELIFRSKISSTYNISRRLGNVQMNCESGDMRISIDLIAMGRLNAIEWGIASHNFQIH